MGGSYPSAEVQSVYSTAPADWAKYIFLNSELKNKLDIIKQNIIIISKGKAVVDEENKIGKLRLNSDERLMLH